MKNVSSDNAVGKKLQYLTNPVESAKEHSKEVQQEAESRSKMTADSNYLASIFSHLNSGWYDAGRLKSLQNISCGSYSAEGGSNSMLYAQLQSYIKNIQEVASKQAEQLKDFDFGTTFDKIDLKETNGAVATKEDYDFAQEILKELKQNGDNSVSFNEVLAEVQSGKYGT